MKWLLIFYVYANFQGQLSGYQTPSQTIIETFDSEEFCDDAGKYLSKDWRHIAYKWIEKTEYKCVKLGPKYWG